MGALEQRVRDLERKYAAVTAERDELQRDVEALCLSQSGDMFSTGSYVLTERIKATEAELKEERARSASLVASKEKLLEDMANLQIAKVAATTLSAQQGSRLDHMEKDLQHYQVQRDEQLLCMRACMHAHPLPMHPCTFCMPEPPPAPSALAHVGRAAAIQQVHFGARSGAL